MSSLWARAWACSLSYPLLEGVKQSLVAHVNTTLLRCTTVERFFCKQQLQHLVQTEGLFYVDTFVESLCGKSAAALKFSKVSEGPLSRLRRGDEDTFTVPVIVSVKCDPSSQATPFV